MATQASRTYSSSNGIHRSTNSVSSAGSSKSSRSNRSGVESAVTRLLIAIRQLLESLTHWSNGTVTEDQVSDVYVRLGNDFNLAVAAFTTCNISMDDLMNVPQDLRGVLEACLAEDPSPTTLEQYLPQVRQIITNLLQGLRVKQSQYRRLTDKRSSRKDGEGEGDELKSFKRGSSASQGGREDRRSKTPDGVRPPGRNESLPPSIPPFALSQAIELGVDSPPRSRGDSSMTSTPSPRPSSLRTLDTDSVSSASSMTTVGDDILRRGKSLPNTRSVSDSRATPPPLPTSSSQPHTPPTISPPLVPATVKRYSLTDSGVASGPPAVIIQSSSDGNLSRISEGDADPVDDPKQEALLDPAQAPEVASSLRALKKSDTLERRASKRFSTYNFQKMTGARTGPLGSGHRRSFIAGSGSLSPGDLATLVEEDEASGSRGVTRKTSRGDRRGKGPSPVEIAVPPVPTVPPIDGVSPFEASMVVDGLPSMNGPPAGPNIFPPSPTLTVFLQVGREVKKVALDPGISLPSLRVLFMDKFSYNPGQENFPAIYIRDPSSGVQYELEDVEEIKEKCLLLLNIEPLDQIKQHIDTQMATLSRELKDLKSTMNSSNRLGMHAMVSIAPQSPSSPLSRPTDKQFRDAARRLSRIQHDDQPPMAPLQPQMTGAYDSRLVSDLRTQFDEVQNLRRDLGVMRQLYTQFMKQTKESLGGLRGQAQNLRQAANSKVGGARAFIDSGKSRLDSRTQDVLTKVEEFQDAIENVKDDVVKKQISPKPNVVRNLKSDMDAISTELESLQEHIRNVKPMWKKTWEEELQNIVEEQQFLVHQEELLEDLVQDIQATAEVHNHLEKLLSMKGAGVGGIGSARGRYKQRPPPEESEGGLNNVMLQIKGASVDTERRLKAIEQNQKARAKEQAGRADEFEAELSGFVKGGKLKMTGGADEVDRVVQKKSEAALKAMFTGEQI